MKCTNCGNTFKKDEEYYIQSGTNLYKKLCWWCSQDVRCILCGDKVNKNMVGHHMYHKHRREPNG